MCCIFQVLWKSCYFHQHTSETVYLLFSSSIFFSVGHILQLYLSTTYQSLSLTRSLLPRFARKQYIFSCFQSFSFHIFLFASRLMSYTFQLHIKLLSLTRSPSPSLSPKQSPFSNFQSIFSLFIVFVRTYPWATSLNYASLLISESFTSLINVETVCLFFCYSASFPVYLCRGSK